MPDATSTLSVITAITGPLAGIGGFLVSFFYVSRKVGAGEERFAAHGKSIEENRKLIDMNAEKHSREIEETRQRIDAQAERQSKNFDELMEMFKVDGEPRFVTYRAHDKMQLACQNLMNLRLSNIESQNGVMSDKLDMVLMHLAHIPKRRED